MWLDFGLKFIKNFINFFFILSIPTFSLTNNKKIRKAHYLHQFIRGSFYEWRKNLQKNGKRINRFRACNKKHFRNDILHSIIIKWSMFMWIFFIPFIPLAALFFVCCAAQLDSLNKLFIYFSCIFSFSFTFLPISFFLQSYLLPATISLAYSVWSK